jgi:hypothetical protein
MTRNAARPDCVNLRERFGDRYRVRYEESYAGEGFRAAEAPCLMIIPCRYGHIFPWDGQLPAVSTDKRGQVARKICQLPFVTVRQDGDDGVNATFPLDRFADVAQIMRPRRRRRLSPEQRGRAAAVLAKYHFPAARQAPRNGLERAPTGQDGSRHQEPDSTRI